MQPFADRGTIWTVPRVSPDAICLVLKRDIVPLYFAWRIGPPNTGDFCIRSRETDLGQPLYAALWNVRRLIRSHLGRRIGRLLCDLDFSERHIDDEPRPLVEDWRAREITKWLNLSQRLSA